MNKTEQAYSQTLDLMLRNGAILWWKFEAVTLKLAPDTRYTPDFIAMWTDGSIEFIEVKARKKGKDGKPDTPLCEDDAKVKIKVASAMFPFRFALVWPDGAGGWSTKEIEAA